MLITTKRAIRRYIDRMIHREIARRIRDARASELFEEATKLTKMLGTHGRNLNEMNQIGKFEQYIVYAKNSNDLDLLKKIVTKLGVKAEDISRVNRSAPANERNAVKQMANKFYRIAEKIIMNRW